MRRAASALALALVLGPLALGQDRPDPAGIERLLGPGALFVLSVPRSPAAARGYEASGLRKLLEHEEVRAFLAPFESWLEKRKTAGAAGPGGRRQPPLNEMSRELTGLTIDEIAQLLSGPFGLAVYDLPLSERRALDLVVAIGAEDGAPLSKAAAKVKEALGRQGAPLKEGEFQRDGVTFHELGNDDFKVFWAVLNRTLFVATTQARLEQIAASAAKPSPSILDDPAYQAVRRRCSPQGDHVLSAWVGVAGILRKFKAEIGDEARLALEALGVADIDSAALAVGFEDGLLVERYALAAARQDRGLLKILSGGSPEDPARRFVPSGALAYAHAGLDLAASYDTLMEAAKAVPELDQEVRQGLKEFEDEAGVDVRKLLAAFGPSWTSWAVLPEGGGILPYEITAVPLRDPEQLELQAKKLGDFLGIHADSLRFRGKTIHLASFPLDGADELGDLTDGLLRVAVPAAWAIEEGTLFFSWNPLALKRHFLHAAAAPPIAEDPRYAELAARVPPGNREAWIYVDIGRSLNSIYSTFEPIVVLGRDFARDPDSGEPILDLARLPLGETLADLVGPSLTTKRTLPGAIVIESRSRTGLSPTAMYAGIGLLAGAATAGFAHAGRAAPILELEGVAGNELLAGVSLQLLRQAQETFKNSDSDRNGVADYWTRDVAGLWGLKDAAGQPVFLVDPALAQADPDGAERYGLGKNPRSGFLFKAMVTDADGEPYAKDDDKDGNAFTNKARWAVCAWPAAYGATGRMTFLVSQDGKVWKKDLQGKPADRWPGKNPADEGWEPAE